MWDEKKSTDRICRTRILCLLDLIQVVDEFFFLPPLLRI